MEHYKESKCVSWSICMALLGHMAPKATHAMAGSTLDMGSISIRGHDLIKLGKKKHRHTNTSISLCWWQAEPRQHREEGASCTAGLYHPKSCCSSSSPLESPWQWVGCQHHADTKGVINTRTSLWQGLSKHVATQEAWSIMSDKALYSAKVFHWQTESRSSVLAAPTMPQAAFPLHKAKTAQEKG